MPPLSGSTQSGCHTRPDPARQPPVIEWRAGRDPGTIRSLDEWMTSTPREDNVRPTTLLACAAGVLAASRPGVSMGSALG
ncbi:hypothetical protein AAII07_06655 [Microvirga sp. 0TCS3.31]